MDYSSSLWPDFSSILDRDEYPVLLGNPSSSSSSTSSSSSSTSSSSSSSSAHAGDEGGGVVHVSSSSTVSFHVSESLHGLADANPLPDNDINCILMSPSGSGTSFFRDEVPKRVKIDPQSSPVSKSPINQCHVRKFGDKITALQELVSPFGKTDTASVLLEAIGYIKFLQEQVHVLSSPYMASSSKKGCEAKPSLQSRGLCLVPISCTRNVVPSNNGADYWISGLSGCGRS